MYITGWCSFNLYDFDFLDAYDKKRYTHDCDPDDIRIRDWFTNNTIFDPNDPEDPGDDGPQTINWLVYNTSDPLHKTTLCLAHTCMWVVPVWQPAAFINGFLLWDFEPATKSFDTDFDLSVYDKMCELILEPHSWRDRCFEAHISTMFSLTEDTVFDYACVYTYACSKQHEYLLEPSDYGYEGKK